MLDFSKIEVNDKVGGSIVDGAGGYSLEERVRKMERDLWELKDNRVKSSEDCERLERELNEALTCISVLVDRYAKMNDLLEVLPMHTQPTEIYMAN